MTVNNRAGQTFGRQNLFLLLGILFASILLLSGCSLSELERKAQSLPGSSLDLPVIGGNKKQEVEEKRYLDEKTGKMVSEMQYKANHFVDSLKYYGLYVAIPSFAIGFLIRRIVHGSAAIRRIGFFFEVAVPIIYVILAYVLSAAADAIK